jgi:pyruvate-ferredoxin/flavodoxin oxidoreductase
MQNQKAAVETGQWLLYRYHPERGEHGDNPFTLDSRPPKQPLKNYLQMENRFKMLELSKPDVAKELFELAQNDVDIRYAMYQYLAQRPFNGGSANGGGDAS